MMTMTIFSYDDDDDDDDDGEGDDEDDDNDDDHDHGTKMMTLPPVNLWIKLAEPSPPPGVEQSSTSLRTITKNL